jgi:hypothetical protein
MGENGDNLQLSPLPGFQGVREYLNINIAEIIFRNAETCTILNFVDTL